MRHTLATVLVIVTAPAGYLTAGWASASAPPHLPTVQIMRATLDRNAHTVDLRVRICYSAGRRAQVTIIERRTFHGRHTTHRWAPRGEEPTRVSRFTCRTGWRLNWLLEPRLRGPGTYTATIRVRDGFGRWSPAVAFTVVSA
jgi:hypothetical protein